MSTHSLSDHQTENKRLSFLRQFIGKPMDQHFSPVAKWLNGSLISIGEGEMVVEYLVREDMCNPMGTLHGGIAATILDDIVGTMVYALGREFGFTSVNLNCDFLNPAIVGDVLVAKSTVIRAGKNIIHVEGRLVNTQGRIIAKCTSNLMQTTFKLPLVPGQ
ncbi:PaaI family thioesterase [Dyadobacter sp. CY261]|uniref:PaaI family thioesterase n=1 Tax=Dyadobacter sp. CY261 TaxID=2907203 RepID=UPI001F4297A6|nr:PaaI family thioesterase [Dyadobacter sp. CY261]MCF0071957.1 PaaI family thioesterase [Dyadobacter sp. CY261]